MLLPLGEGTRNDQCSQAWNYQCSENGLFPPGSALYSLSTERGELLPERGELSLERGVSPERVELLPRRGDGL